MAGIQLFQDEELFLRFRPHFLSFVPHYAGALGWVIAGAVGAAVGVFLTEVQHPSIWALFTLALVGLAGGFIRRKLRGGSMAYPWFAALFCVAVVMVVLFSRLPDRQPWLPAIGVGIVLALVRLVGWELMRIQRLHFLTSQRLVVRAGLGHRQEESLPLTRIQEIRSSLALMGQMFDYGDIVLGLGTSGRGKNAREDTWILAGIGRLSEVKHQLEELVEELRLNPKERRRRMEERRLRESMRKLAAWMRKDRSQGHLSL